MMTSKKNLLCCTEIFRVHPSSSWWMPLPRQLFMHLCTPKVNRIQHTTMYSLGDVFTIQNNTKNIRISSLLHLDGCSLSASAWVECSFNNSKHNDVNTRSRNFSSQTSMHVLCACACKIDLFITGLCMYAFFLSIMLPYDQGYIQPICFYKVYTRYAQKITYFVLN